MNESLPSFLQISSSRRIIGVFKSESSSYQAQYSAQTTCPMRSWSSPATHESRHDDVAPSSAHGQDVIVYTFYDVGRCAHFTDTCAGAGVTAHSLTEADGRNHQTHKREKLGRENAFSPCRSYVVDVVHFVQAISRSRLVRLSLLALAPATERAQSLVSELCRR